MKRAMIRISIATGLFLFMSAANAMGGIWLLEINYLMDGESRTTFVLADFWANDFDQYVGNDSLFAIELQKQLGNSGPVIVFDEIIDQEEIASIAAFPMSPFHVVAGSKSTLRLEDISKPSLTRIWKKDDYVVNVLTALTLSDTTWISDSASKELPLGEEVGCRLEVYSFDASKDVHTLMQEFTGIYSKKESDRTLYDAKSRMILQNLKANKVVVVELCGC